MAQEHKCVLDSCRSLEMEGFQVTYLPVQSNGVIDLKVSVSVQSCEISSVYHTNEVLDVLLLHFICLSICHTDQPCQSGRIMLSDFSVTGCLYTHTHPFNGPFSGTTQVSRYQKGKTNLDFTKGRDCEWQWHQLGRMQVCTSLQTDNHASTPPLQFFTGRVPNQQRQSTEGILLHNAVVIGLGVVQKLCEFLTPFTFFSLLQ